MNRSKSLFFILVVGLVSLLSACKSADPNVAGGNANVGSIDQKISVSGACVNAYYPATPTLKRTYKTSFAGNSLSPSTYTESFKNFTSDGYTYRMNFEPRESAKAGGEALTLEGGIKCSPQGLMLMEYANLQAGNAMNVKVKTTKAEGVTYPVESEWKVGKKWNMKYDVEMQFDQKLMPQMKVNPQGTYEMDWEIVGQEAVTVPAGTFDALKVILTFKNNISMSMGGVKIPSGAAFQSTVWVAKDVGMVKTVMDKANATTELISLVK